MKAAVLCNGPSRVLYVPDTKYDFVMGCNIPWTTVDATVVIDVEVVNVWAKNPSLITVPTYFSEVAWRHTSTMRKRNLFEPYFAGIIKVQPQYHSSGHNAAEVVLSKGYDDIDIYGCDSWFIQSCESYTNQFVPQGPNVDMRVPPKVRGWRERWHKIMDGHPNVKFNFIKHENIHQA